MELCLLGILTGLFVLWKGLAASPERIVCTSGEQVSLPCEWVSSHTRWFWLPLSSRCANVNRSNVEITWNPTKDEVLPLRFNQRLINQTSGSLVLRNLVMSDAGTYVCRLPNGSETRTILEVTTGCHNNLFVSFRWLSASSLRLSCRHCDLPGRVKANSFRWMLNSQRLGNPHWAEKSNSGSFVTLLSTPRGVWGRWECHFLANRTWISEICLQAPIEENGADTLQAIYEDSSAELTPSLTPSLWPRPAIAKTTEAAGAEPGDMKGIWPLLLVGLVLVPATLGMTVWLWKKNLTAGKQRERKERTVVMTSRMNEDIYGSESLGERSASLHYAQLQHPRRKSTSVRTPDSTTVYAVIV
ncbi:megakaryocyte and platelet inhibitory receptor G6b [Rhineura floridana]|uniref:megakaryocyte and platelet inhibitory receptor G6b n=1 Tax=Rhineura floridana TaxID=261503 RepID=UPI002AC81B37|nr:megakaryocyte and platelet inhibitory receptor G6b [Rhineura floridana]